MRNIFRQRWGCTFVVDGTSVHSFRDLGLLPAAPPNFGYAEPEIVRVPIPGASGSLDLSDTLTGYTAYRDRMPELLFYLPGTERQRETLRAKTAAALHGRLVQIVPDESPDGYWYGRLQVEAPVHDSAADTLTVSGYLDPYKYDRRRTDQDWLWDPFNFETGVIREYGSLTVDGSLTVTVVSSPIGGCPTFITSAAMTVTYDGTTYSLPAGSSAVDAIELPHSETEVTFTFAGTGTVAIRFRAGWL